MSRLIHDALAIINAFLGGLSFATSASQLKLKVKK